MQRKSVSIIVPVYNGSKTIHKSLKSALRQNVDVEIIVIDDCSEDTTVEIVSKLSARYPSIRIIRMKRHSGAGPCRNLGLEEAEGKYVAFLDADDVFVDRVCLKKMVLACERNDLMICGSFRQVRKGLFVQRSDLYRNLPWENSSEIILDYFDYQYDYDFTSYIYNAEFLRNHNLRFPSLLRYQDVPFFISSMVSAKVFGVVPVECYRYTIHKDVAFDDHQLLDILRGMLIVVEVAERENLQLLKNRTIARMESDYSKLLAGLFERNLLARELRNMILGYSD